MTNSSMGSLQATLEANLNELVDRFRHTNATELWICSAYINSGGVEAIRPLLNVAGHVRVVLGAGDQTEPEAVQALLQRTPDVRLRHVPRAEFHPKCYLGVASDGQAWAAVGSANLTQAGASRNVELMTVVEGPAAHPYFVGLLRWFRQQYRDGHEPTGPIMEAVKTAWDARERAQSSTGQKSARQLLEERFAQADSKRGSRDVFRYIQKTRLYASYKLVILGTLLQSGGRLSLEECADRFLAFYQALEKLGLPAERTRGGGRQLLMRTPGGYDRDRVIRLLEGRKGQTITTRGIVRYRETQSGITILTVPSLSSEEQEDALEALLERLEEYYRIRVGAEVTAAVLKEALRLAAETMK